MCDPATTQTRNGLYHVARSGYGIGDDILPGWFGRDIRHFREGILAVDANTLKTLMWEMAMETVRRLLAPDAVSRMDCVYACETLEMGRAFRDRFRPGHTIYAVEPWQGVKLYRGDFGLISYKEGLNGAYIDFMPAIAIQYWMQEPGEHVEVLVGGAVKVVSVVEQV